MSSRLFQELREERGLAYSIYAWTQGFADTGLFAVNLSTDKARAAEALSWPSDTSSGAVDVTATPSSNRARAQIEAGLLMALETPGGRADSMARSIEIFGRIMVDRGDARRARAVTSTPRGRRTQAMLDGPRARHRSAASSPGR